ncbi:MAG: methyltransferase [Hyphobacterium sp.]|nr:MAG: methyltransferase [Hyphobacterium sp.]
MTEAVTLLGGQVVANQVASGFRSGLDAVLLGASIQAQLNENLLEFGCGSGAATLVAAFHNADSRFDAFDIDPAMVDLAQSNIAANGWTDRIGVCPGDVADFAGASAMDQVFFNPPFFDDASVLASPSEGKRRAYLAGNTPLESWLKRANQVLKPKGRLTLIHRADRLDDILVMSRKWFGDVVVKPIAPYADQSAKRVLVSARKGVKGRLTLLSPLVLHDGSDRQYTEEAEAVLRGSDRIVVR